MAHRPFLHINLVTGFFYGAKQKAICGVGMVIKFHLKHKYLLGVGVGKGRNTKAGLLALCDLLWFSQKKNISALQVLGDSKAIVDWDNKFHQIHSLELEH